MSLQTYNQNALYETLQHSVWEPYRENNALITKKEFIEMLRSQGYCHDLNGEYGFSKYSETTTTKSFKQWASLTWRSQNIYI